MEFFEHLKLEVEDIQDELRSVPLQMTSHRIGDFGCGEGYTTLSLMLALQATECVGIDKSSNQNAQEVFNAVRDSNNKIYDNLKGNSLQQDLHRLLGKSDYPVFQRGDILKDYNLPNNFDFAYCKKVLGNIYSGEYDNLPNGEEGVSIAINNIVRTIKQGGIFCAVEKASAYFAPILERSGLTFLRICRIQRGEIGTDGRITSTAGIGQYFVYCYQKA